jgi:hypothetical protein
MTPIVDAGLPQQTSTRLLIVMAVAVLGARILGSTPLQGENDRSRWVTVRALVDHGTYVIGHRDQNEQTGGYTDRGIMTEPGWDTVDKVLRPDTGDFYSSKPPLLSTLVAGEYWLLKKVFGWSITLHPWKVGRIILLTFNGVPFLVYLVLLARLVDRFGTTAWGRQYVLAASGFGTFLTTFAVTLNNHTVAACCALFALYPFLRIWSAPPAISGKSLALSRKVPAPSVLDFASCGFFAGLTACTELPAALLAALLALLLWIRAPWRTLGVYLPAVAVPVAGLLITNYLAIGQLQPAYSEFGGPWYEYEGSPWRRWPLMQTQDIDAIGQLETKLEYAFHLLEGHHGILSLSPIYCLTVAGMFYSPRGRHLGQQDSAAPDSAGHVFPSLNTAWKIVRDLTTVLTVVIFAFYVLKSNNYGGLTSGPRWFIWLTPFWLLTLIPVADWLSVRRWRCWLAYLLLAVAIFSTTFPGNNPWQDPWLYQLLEEYGWLNY